MALELRQKLEILADAAKYDASCASSGVKKKGLKNKLGNSTGVGICHSYTPDGRCVSLLKILFTNYCIFDCHYCINRVTSNVKRAAFTVDEVVSLTINFYKRNYIEGLFLSSGIIKNPDYTMEQLVEVAKRLRLDEGFNGYVHLKAVAGASSELLQQASLWADRLSANIEISDDSKLQSIAPGKSHQQIEAAMGDIKQTRSSENLPTKVSEQKVIKKRTPAGQSTQMIVGLGESTDLSMLTKSNFLYKTFGLKRVYYSAYSPIPDSHAHLPANTPPLIREHRLYQADWLMRFYGFNVDEILGEDHPDLKLGEDPKLTWALRNRAFFPVDINRCTKEELVRVPGIGIRNALKIIKARRFSKIKFSDLKKLRVQLNKAKFFIVTADFNPYVHQLDRLALDTQPKEQLSLFSEKISAISGEL